MLRNRIIFLERISLNFVLSSPRLFSPTCHHSPRYSKVLLLPANKHRVHSCASLGLPCARLSRSSASAYLGRTQATCFSSCVRTCRCFADAQAKLRVLLLVRPAFRVVQYKCSSSHNPTRDYTWHSFQLRGYLSSANFITNLALPALRRSKREKSP